MKTKIAMLISVTGVLAAGSAAALVNTQVLGGSASQAPLVGDAPTPSNATVPVSSPVVSSPVDTSAPAVSTPVTAAPVGTQAVYEIGQAGSVTLDTAGDVLTIVAVTPAPGWTVTKAETNTPTNAEIKFQAGAVEIEFKANLLFGVVTTSVETNDSSVTSSSVEDSGGSGRHGGGSDDNGGGSDD